MLGFKNSPFLSGYCVDLLPSESVPITYLSWPLESIIRCTPISWLLLAILTPNRSPAAPFGSGSLGGGTAAGLLGREIPSSCLFPCNSFNSI